MTDTSKLAEALAAFQAEMPVVGKNKTADTGTFSYTYADLADVTAAAMPLLTKHGLSFSACPRGTAHGYELAGILLHTSGERLEGSLPLHGNNPQQLGSALTYARRYLLGCITGIVTDDDVDAAPAATARRTGTPPPPDPREEQRQSLLTEVREAAEAAGVAPATVAEEWAASHEGQHIAEATDLEALRLLRDDLRGRAT